MNPALQGFVKILFQMVWADDVVTPNEVKAVTGVLRQLGLTHPQIVCMLDANLTEKPTDPPVPLDEIFEDRNFQLEALKSVMKICLADGRLQPEVQGYIEGTIIRMGVTASELEAIRQETMKR
ncbi:MAG: hypothetical protein AB7S38_12795 [Vulcanimicrobiota bacterium]